MRTGGDEVVDQAVPRHDVNVEPVLLVRGGGWGRGRGSVRGRGRVKGRRRSRGRGRGRGRATAYLVHGHR